MDKENAEWASAQREADDADLRADALRGRMERLVRAAKLLCDGDRDAAYRVLTRLDDADRGDLDESNSVVNTQRMEPSG